MTKYVQVDRVEAEVTSVITREQVIEMMIPAGSIDPQVATVKIVLIGAAKPKTLTLPVEFFTDAQYGLLARRPADVPEDFYTATRKRRALPRISTKGLDYDYDQDSV